MEKALLKKSYAYRGFWVLKGVPCVDLGSDYMRKVHGFCLCIRLRYVAEILRLRRDSGSKLCVSIDTLFLSSALKSAKDTHFKLRNLALSVLALDYSVGSEFWHLPADSDTSQRVIQEAYKGEVDNSEIGGGG